MVRMISPFLRYTCPHCKNSFHPGQCAIVSGQNPGMVLNRPFPGFLGRLLLREIKGRKYEQESALPECPNPGCKQPLPYNIARATSHTIAIVGDSTSGKSHYIASCIDQLRQRQMLQVLRCARLLGQGDTDKEYRDTYYDRVYRDHQKIPGTQRGVVRDPLVYELVFQQTSNFQPPRSVNLLFYDSSGEDMIEQYRMVEFSPYILNASAIIFLADPLAMPSVVAALPAHLRPPVVRPDSTADVLNRIMRTFEMKQGVTPGMRVSTPIAITVSKSDLLKFVLKGNTLPLYLRDSTSTNRLDTHEFETINEEIRSFLQSIGDHVLVHSSQLFKNTSFFAVSATGWPDDHGKYPSIEPMRVLDPLLWALAKIGVITPE
jgi:hypothetical protein